MPLGNREGKDDCEPEPEDLLAVLLATLPTSDRGWSECLAEIAGIIWKPLNCSVRRFFIRPGKVCNIKKSDIA